MRSVAVAGYAAFGGGVSSDVLLDTRSPPAAALAAHAMVIVHVAAGYQVRVCAGCAHERI
jgi:hypothetical protein